MPRRYRKKGNRPRKARKSGRKSGRGMPSTATSGKGQYAKIIETIEFADLTPNALFQSIFSLSQFPRAATLAGNFAFYKAAKVMWNYEPLYNTFQDSVGASTVPYLYTLMNRGQMNPSPVPGLKNIQACGARPIKLVSKTTIAYKPNWCSPGLLAVLKADGTEPGAVNNVLQQGTKQQYDWLACSGQEVRSINGTSVEVPNLAPVVTANIDGTDGIVVVPPPAGIFSAVQVPNNVVYNGHLNWIDQEVDANSQPVARLTCTVEWNFKGALFNSTIAPGTA